LGLWIGVRFSMRLSGCALRVGALLLADVAVAVASAGVAVWSAGVVSTTAMGARASGAASGSALLSAPSSVCARSAVRSSPAQSSSAALPTTHVTIRRSRSRRALSSKCRVSSRAASAAESLAHTGTGERWFMIAHNLVRSSGVGRLRAYRDQVPAQHRQQALFGSAASGARSLAWATPSREQR